MGEEIKFGFNQAQQDAEIQEQLGSLYLAGSSPLDYIVRELDGNWLDHCSIDQWQKKNGVDSMSCVSYSFNTGVEQNINMLIASGKLSGETLEWLHKKGYIIDGRVVLSNRFLAIKSNTTKNGNSCTNVAYVARHVGFIPYTMLPDDFQSFEQYHDKSVITVEMEALGLESLQKFDIFYEVIWSSMTRPIGVNTKDDRQRYFQHHLKHAPIQLAIKTCPGWSTTEPVPYCSGNANHAIDLASVPSDYVSIIVDHYNPFVKKLARDYEIGFAMKVLVFEKNEFTAQEITDARKFALDLVKTKPSRIGFRYEKNGEAYRIELDGSLKYKHAVPSPLFTALCEDGTIWGINEQIWSKLKPALIK